MAGDGYEPPQTSVNWKKTGPGRVDPRLTQSAKSSRSAGHAWQDFHAQVWVLFTAGARLAGWGNTWHSRRSAKVRYQCCTYSESGSHAIQ